MKFKSKSPFSGEEYGSFPFLTNSELDTRITKASNAQQKHQKTALSSRADNLLKLNDLLEQRKQDFAQIITEEMGKPIKQSIAEIEKCAWLCRYYSELGPSMLSDEYLLEEGKIEAFSAREPLGLMLAIMPWNFPFWQLFRCAVPAILAGNGVLLKHAPNVPRCALAMEALFTEAGFEDGLMTNLFIDILQVELLLSRQEVRGMSLTGSTAAGKAAAELSGKHLVKTVLELGGSDPFIVFDDADIASAVEQLILSRFLNNGQSCIAAKRLLIQSGIEDAFLESLKHSMEQIIWGDPMHPDTFLSCLARQDLKDQLDKQVDICLGKEWGGEVFYEGLNWEDSPATSFRPKIITNLKAPSKAWDQELFGPVLTVWSFDSAKEALDLANNTVFGLGASVWTADIEKAIAFGRQIQAGNVFINDMVKSDPRMPFGGIKQSGIGRELAREGLLEFTNSKTICVNHSH